MLGGSARGREWAGGPAKPRTLHTRRARRGQASCGELTLRDSRREQQAGAGTVPEQRDEAQPEAGHRAGSLSGGHGWECWRRGGAAEQKGKGSLFFWSFAKPTVKSEQSPRPLSLLTPHTYWGKSPKVPSGSVIHWKDSQSTRLAVTLVVTVYSREGTRIKVSQGKKHV